ncbi:hypothetical protein PLCT1_00965 [Planctomycetaceae bacterium]|nr:hypothetical protein PLCT1_00965 [Planctomycetaceae bacterium]
MNRYSVEIGNVPHFERRRLEKKGRGKPVADSRVLRRAVPYRQAEPSQPVVHQALPMFQPAVVYVPVMPMYAPPVCSSGDDVGMFLGGGVTGGLIVGLFAIFLAILI